MSRGAFILRDETAVFENRMANRMGLSRPVIGVSSGTAALELALMAAGIGPGDEVITVAHTFVATLSAIVRCGAKPVLIDVEPDGLMDLYKIESAITEITKAIIPVHMNGARCCVNLIALVANRHKLKLIEDCAQAIGASLQNPVGTYGNFGCFSMAPMKILGAAGDAGFVCAKSDVDDAKIRSLRNHGKSVVYPDVLERFGTNARLANLQAAILNVKLNHLDEWIGRRHGIASSYRKSLAGINGLILPAMSTGRVFSSYVIKTPRRDALKAHLEANGIETMIHWSPALHRQYGLGLPPFDLPVTDKLSRECLSLPIHHFMTDDEQNLVIRAIQMFFAA